MDDFLAQFKEARQRERDAYEKLGEELRAHNLRSYDQSAEWNAYVAAVQAFDAVSRRFADYLLGGETQ